MAAARVREADLRVVVGSVTPTPTLLEVDLERSGRVGGGAGRAVGLVHALPSGTCATSSAFSSIACRSTGDGAGGVIAVAVTVNGRHYLEDVEPRLLLSDFVRHRLGLTGTHVGCEHGVCGACTVRLDGVAVRSCLLLAAQVDGSELVTVEGLAGDGTLTPLQAAFNRHHALQCGFCTPGS